MTIRFEIPELETERLRMRAPRQSDYPALAEFYATERAKFVGGPQAPYKTWRGLAAEIGHWVLRGYGRWALEEKATGAYVGTCGLWMPEDFPELELGWDLLDGATGKGYATEAGRAARAHAYDALGYETIVSMIAPGNAASKAVAGRLGAVFDKHFTHVEYGEVELWRHPGPEALIA